MEYIELGKIAEFVRGPFGGSLKKSIFVNDGIAVYEQQHAIYNQFNQIRYFIDESKFNEMKRFEVNPNDIIMSCSGTMGKVAIVPKDVKKGIINQALLKITPSSKLDSRFLEYYMKSTIFFNFLNADAKGTAIKNVASVKELKKIPIMVIPLEEQQAIVNKLDQAFAAIDQAKANIEKNIANAKELFQSKLNQIFSQKGDGWVQNTLGELCQFSQGIQRDVKLQSEICGENQVRFLRIVDFTQGNELPRFIDFPGEKYIISPVDIALVRYGASTGFVCRGLEGALANNMFRVIPKSEIISKDFLKIYLESFIFQNVIKIMMNGAAMPAISFGMIDKLPFPFPKSLEKQQQIVTQLDQLQEQTNLLVAKYEQKLANLEELKKSILEKAFKGELTNKSVQI